MPFERFVQTGRIAKCAFGPLRGRLVSIVDVIDQNKVLVDGPCTGVTRQAYQLNNLHLTKFRLKYPFNASTRVVRKSWKEFDVRGKWRASAWADKATDYKKRTQLNDFDRFKLRTAKRTKNKLLAVAYNKVKKHANRDGTLYGPKSIVPYKPKDKKRRQRKDKTAEAKK